MTNSRPIFIIGAHKSGSTLLRSLLDGHPDLFVVPIETHFFQKGGYEVDYRLRKTSPQVLADSDRIAAYLAQVERYNAVSDPMSDSHITGQIDLNRVQQILEAGENDSETGWFLNYMRAIHAGVFGTDLLPEQRIVEKSVENAEFVPDLKSMFPQAKFIHVIRNPYANLVSLRRHTGRKHYPFLMPSISSLCNSYYNLKRNLRHVEDYLVVRYESILQETERLMRQTADFLDIEFTRSLTNPTLLQEPWGGNSSRGKQYEGVSTENLNAWREEINHLEIYYTNRYYSTLLDEYGTKHCINRNLAGIHCG